MKFKDLPLSQEMLNTIESLGYTEATKIQATVIPEGLKGRDVIGQAFTGTGKTAAFSIPIIENTTKYAGFQHLILAPSRELANQIHKEFLNLSQHAGLRVATIVGGISYNIQHRNLKQNPEIIIATPGRLMDIMDKGWVTFDKLKTLTLDEADEMLNFGFHKDIVRINEAIDRKVQTYFLTATFNDKIKQLAKKMLEDPFEVVVSDGMKTSDKILQKHLVMKEKEKLRILYMLIKIHEPEGAVIFGRTRRRVQELTDALNELNISTVGIQGDMAQKDREFAMRKFREKKVQILVATDVLARGIDVDHVDFVFNFDLPSELEYYTHRIGRTGRAGRIGTSISFMRDNEIPYYDLIMKTTGSKSEEIKKPNESDLQEMKAIALDKRLVHLETEFGDKFDRVGAKIAEKYDANQLGVFVAKLLLGEETNLFDIQLTPEQSAGGNKKYRNQMGGGDRKGGGRSRSRSRGRNDRGGGHRGSRGGDRKERGSRDRNSHNKKNRERHFNNKGRDGSSRRRDR